MTKQEALEKLEKYKGKWLYRDNREDSGEFFILDCRRDPFWIKKAMYLGSQEQIEAAAELVAEVTSKEAAA